MPKIVRVVPLLAVVVVAGCASSPTVNAQRPVCLAFDEVVRSASLIEVPETPELAKEKAWAASAQAEIAARSATGDLAVRMQQASDDLAAVASTIGRAQYTDPAGPVPDLTGQMATVQADFDAVAALCRAGG